MFLALILRFLLIFLLVNICNGHTFFLKAKSDNPMINGLYIGVDNNFAINLNNITTRFAITRKGFVWAPNLNNIDPPQIFEKVSFLRKYKGAYGALTYKPLEEESDIVEVYHIFNRTSDSLLNLNNTNWYKFTKTLLSNDDLIKGFDKTDLSKETITEPFTTFEIEIIDSLDSKKKKN